ncbi:hypothetical protein JCM10450v2_007124 [Rhodotorula kratochvilovae]
MASTEWIAPAPTGPPASLPPPAWVCANGTHIGTAPEHSYENGRGRVVFVKRVEWAGREMVVKYGPGVRTKEAEVMRMVRDKTSIPVPEVYSVDEHEGDLFIYQELLPGFLAYITELHAVRAPPGIAMGLLGSTTANKLQWVWGPLRLRHPREREPDLYTTVELLDYLAAQPKALDPRVGGDKEKLASVDPSAPVVPTHCDLHAGNVLVSPDCRTITGIVDWELASWLPEWADAHASAVHAEVDAWAGGRDDDTAGSAFICLLTVSLQQ